MVQDPELLALLDKVNSAIEVAILLPFVNDCWRIVRVGTSISVSMETQAAYLAYCCWTGAYFFVLDQPYSYATAFVWAAAYCAKMALVRRYRPARLKGAEP